MRVIHSFGSDYTNGTEDSPEYFGLPTKLFEYMGMHRPIIATSVGQQSDVIMHNHNGVLINEKSSDEIAEALKLLWIDKALSSNISYNARNDAVNKCDWQNNARTIINAYQNIIYK